MGIRRYNPTSPGRRGASVSDFAELTPGYKVEKSLTFRKKKHGGRNNQGVITARHRGGGSARQYRMVDFSVTRMAFLPRLIRFSTIQPHMPCRVVDLC